MAILGLISNVYPCLKGINNELTMGSSEVQIDRAYPGALPDNRCQIAIHFYGRGWPSK